MHSIDYKYFFVNLAVVEDLLIAPVENIDKSENKWCVMREAININIILSSKVLVRSRYIIWYAL